VVRQRRRIPGDFPRHQESIWKALAEEQRSKLWWQAFEKICATDPYGITTVMSTLNIAFGLKKDLYGYLEEQWSYLISKLLKNLKLVPHSVTTPMIVREKRNNIIKILETVSETLGFGSATLAGACIVLSL
jgi:hypothetical protein